jgi:hypothetical protein
MHLIEPGPDRAVIGGVPPEKAIFGPAGSSTSLSALRFAAMKSRLSIMAEVIWRWLTRDPERGDQGVPVLRR